MTERQKQDDTQPAEEPGSLRKAVEAALPQVARLLPHQGPIEVFIHQNTLHCLENLSFWDGLAKGSELYGARSAMTEQSARQAYARGRITDQDLLSCLPQKDGSETIVHGVTRNQFRLALFRVSQPVDRASSIVWLLEEHHAVDEWRNDVAEAEQKKIVRSSYHAALKAQHKDANHDPLKFVRDSAEKAEFVRLQEHLQRLARLKIWGKHLGFHDFSAPLSLRILWASCLTFLLECPADSLPIPENEAPQESRTRVNHLLIRLAESFLDQGIARWTLPERELGFWKSAILHLKSPAAAKPRWLEPLSSYIEELSNLSVDEGFLSLIEKSKIHPEEVYDRLLQTSLGLRGWAGLFGELERHPALLTGYPAPVPCSLKEFLAVKLLLELADTPPGSSANKTQERPTHNIEDIRCQLAFTLFHALQVLGISGPELRSLTPDQASAFRTELMMWNEKERCTVWHQAFERHLEEETYRTLTTHQAALQSSSSPYSGSSAGGPARPRFQLICCLDDREESMRRYLEEEGEHVETYGAAGFFGVDMEFVPMTSHPAPFCPVQIHPSHRAIEVPLDKYRHRLNSWRIGQKAWQSSKRAIAGNSVQSLPGLVLHMGLGALASIPLVMRILFPRLAFRVSRYVQEDLLRREDLSDVMFTDEEVKALNPEAAGFTVDEMASRVSGMMKTVGIAGRYGRLVVVLGHGSFSRNNPMRSAYDCGACGGHPGSMNARIFARMANLPAVRAELKKRNLEIPPDTHFLGGYHNTCTDEVTIYDVDAAPAALNPELRELEEILVRVRGKNALERTRRFPISLRAGEYKKAVSYVEWRAQHIGEPRPEFGHATNALCIVGSRSMTRDLFFDRRAFLVSYDRKADPEGSTLLGLLSAVVPVCSGINLEYFFSALDNSVYGAGSKLPQNITCLLGVMTGYESDLRTGLPKQMIDIHEPVRLIFVLDADESSFLNVLEKNPGVRETIENKWIILSLYDPEKNQLRKYLGNGEFEEWSLPAASPKVPEAKDSESWTLGKQGLLPFARLQTEQAETRG